MVAADSTIGVSILKAPLVRYREGCWISPESVDSITSTQRGGGASEGSWGVEITVDHCDSLETLWFPVSPNNQKTAESIADKIARDINDALALVRACHA